VALKVLRQDATRSQLAVQRFHREARAAAGLAHPNLITVYDVGDEKDQFYLVMELVEGRSLAELLKEGSSPFPETVRLLEKVARGVGVAHEKGIIHRDLKPGNILVTPSGEPKVGDFGLAHVVESTQELTRTGTTLGTPLYMAPEQVQGEARAITPRTDVYAMGAILYEVLAGRPPHRAENMMELYGKIVREEPVSPRRIQKGIPAELETIALKALDKDPARRYPTAADFAEDLRRFLAGEPIVASPAGPAYLLYRRLRRNLVPSVLALGVILAAAAAGLGWFGRGAERAAALQAMRQVARTSLEAALECRRAGHNDRMKPHLSLLESVYLQAVERAPDLAEVEYLMGRMYRALMDDPQALQYQERALIKDPRHAPALYERGILLSQQYGRRLRGLVQAETGNPLPVRQISASWAQDLERRFPELIPLRESAVSDCLALEKAVEETVRGGLPWPIPEANLLSARGILAYHRADYAKARELLQGAVDRDPLIEEAWEALALALEAFAAPEEKDAVARLQAAEGCYTNALQRDRGCVGFLIGRAYVRISLGDRNWYLFDKEGKRRRDWFDDYARAEQDLTEAIRMEGASAGAWRGRGILRGARGLGRSMLGEDGFADYVGAEKDLSQAILLDPKPWEAWYWRGLMHLRMAVQRRKSGDRPFPDFQAAEGNYTRALDITGSYPKAWAGRGLARFYMAQILEERGEESEAGRAYAAAVPDLEEGLPFPAEMPEESPETLDALLKEARLKAASAGRSDK
jgi:serine/threonine-protein kinase